MRAPLLSNADSDVLQELRHQLRRVRLRVRRARVSALHRRVVRAVCDRRRSRVVSPYLEQLRMMTATQIPGELERRLMIRDGAGTAAARYPARLWSQGSALRVIRRSRGALVTVG